MSHGHNESAVRLAALAGDAQIALDKVARGEADALEGWLAYGAALNEGRALHTSESGTQNDRGFGGWIEDNDLGQVGQDEVHPKEREAAMWAAANADQLAEARAASKARTLRGWHDQWKKIEAEREEAARKIEQEAAREKAAAEAGAKREAAAAAAKAEADAIAAAKAAPDDQARAEAESRAAQAAAEKEAAEAAAIEAEQTAEPEPDPHAAERRKLAGLTREALEDDLIGLRADLADERERRKKAEAENKTLKGRLDDLLADDRNEVIRRMQRELAHAQSERWRQQDETRRAMAQVHGLKKRVAELERMGVAL